MALRLKGDAPPPAPIEEPEVDDNPTEEAAEPTDATPMMMHGGGGCQVSQDVARYLPPDCICANCIYFMEPNTCEVVAGPVEAQGRCSLFTADDMSQEQPTEDQMATDVAPEPLNGNPHQPPRNA